MTGLESLVEAASETGRERPIFGLVTAKVSSMNQDGTFELTYLSMGDQGPSAPARVVMPMAGRGRGTYFLPEPGDEVIVAFEHGDTRFPVILGALWNEEDPPPDQAEASPENNRRTIVTRSGHELTFDDTPGSEKVILKSKGGHELTLDDSPLGKIKLASRGGGELEILDAAGSLALRAPTSISLESQVITLGAAGGLSIQAAGGVLKIQAPTGMQLTTTGNVAGSTVVIDGRPFGLHTHLDGAGGNTGTVTP